MLLRAGSDLRILLREYTEDPGGDFMVNYGLVVLTDNVDAKFLCARVKRRSV